MPAKSPKPKIYASDAINDLLNAQQYTANNNWLLSYLDVFVLVVMLMVILVSISDFKTQPDKPKRTISKIIKATPKPVQQISRPPAPQPPKRIPEPKPQVTPLTSPALPEPAPNLTAITIETPSQLPEPAIPAPSKIIVEKPQSIEQRLQAELSEKIKRMDLDKSIHLTISQGFAQLEIQDKVLFQSSEAELTSSGKQLLSHLIPMLKESVGIIMIEGHTDNRPIHTKRFPSNWELGASRATSVLHFLVSEQLSSDKLRAISYADTKPIADNTTAEGREKNRRVNIVIKLDNQSP